MDNHVPGKGLIPSPPLTKTDLRLFTYGLAPFDWSTAPVDDGDPTPNLFGVPDKNQDGSGSCTCQSCRNGFYKFIGEDMSVEDPYSHVVLPGGGAYLDAPEAFVSVHGYLQASKHPDPEPETEQAMTTVINVQDGDRVRKFILYTTPIYPISIDAVAQALQNHSYIKLGIKYTGQGWAQSWTDPSFVPNVPSEGHAIACFKDSVVMRNGKKAIKCKSSWCGSREPNGKLNYAHFINEDYFNAGGVFEILAVDVKEIVMPGQNETIYTIDFNGKAGLLFQGGYGANIIYANNPGHYAEIGDAYGKPTCKPKVANPDPNNSADYEFSPFDITLNVPVPAVPGASN